MMWLVSAFLAVATAVDAVVATVGWWGPLLLAAVGLVVVLHLGQRPDTSGPCPDTTPDDPDNTV